ncbi:MAG TPA: bifunctional demethylmenaquinone methyltransferase/2-methoxy-6-polyprenyl-1,4-benzoquinol methylase UbiE [Candidatus Limnocylindria bacterium]
MKGSDRSPAPAPAEVVRMFDRIAPAYDAMNSVMTAGIDARWRRETIAALRLRPGMHVLDVATGTGKLALAAARRVGRDGAVVGLDPSRAMLERARRAGARQVPAARLSWVRGDALALPFPDASFDAVSIGFGLRNLADLELGLREMARVCRPGGRVAVLEIAEPRNPVARLLFGTWFRRVVPRLGSLIGLGSAYAYLPASLDRYPGPEEVARRMADAGLAHVGWRWLATDLATLHVGTRMLDG